MRRHPTELQLAHGITATSELVMGRGEVGECAAVDPQGCRPLASSAPQDSRKEDEGDRGLQWLALGGSPCSAQCCVLKGLSGQEPLQGLKVSRCLGCQRWILECNFTQHGITKTLAISW
jgi:hypothetical protein